MATKRLHGLVTLLAITAMGYASPYTTEVSDTISAENPTSLLLLLEKGENRTDSLTTTADTTATAVESLADTISFTEISTASTPEIITPLSRQDSIDFLLDSERLFDSLKPLGDSVTLQRDSVKNQITLARQYLFGNEDSITDPLKKLEYNLFCRMREIKLMNLSPKAESVLCDAAQFKYDMEVKPLSTTPRKLGKIFMPIVFTEYREEVATHPQMNSNAPYSIENDYYNSLVQESVSDSIRESARARVVATSPQIINYSRSLLPELPNQQELKENALSHLISATQFKPSELKSLNLGLPDVSYWVDKFTSSVQLSQIYVSDNWYQGGESNLNLTSSQNYNISYNDLKKIKFSTNVLWKLGMNSTPNDTLRSARVNEDLFRVESSLGYKAFNRWYYTLSFLFNTQLFNSYKANTDIKTAEFLTPSELNLGLGLQYSYTNKSKTFSVNTTMSPISYNNKFIVNTTDFSPSSFGIEKGKRSKNEIGSTFECKTSWQFAKDMTWTSRLFYYSNYERVLCDFENSFNFIINSYFSTRIFLHARLDDSSRNPEISHLQFKELMSFGFNYWF